MFMIMKEKKRLESLILNSDDTEQRQQVRLHLNAIEKQLKLQSNLIESFDSEMKTEEVVDKEENRVSVYLYFVVPVVALPRNYKSTTRYLQDCSILACLEEKLATCLTSNDDLAIHLQKQIKTVRESILISEVRNGVIINLLSYYVIACFEVIYLFIA